MNYMVIVYWDEMFRDTYLDSSRVEFFDRIDSAEYARTLGWVYAWLGITVKEETPPATKVEFFRRCDNSYILYDVMTRESEKNTDGHQNLVQRT